jgi:formylglycine-generating enzyme required for sulfatase activity
MATVLILTLPFYGCGHKCGLGDRTAELPDKVQLPKGFCPLKGHATLDENDSYDGWPRYIVSSRDQMIMCYVPTQRILMGGGIQVDEVPPRHVVVNHFYIDLHEVTNGQFHKFAERAKWHGASEQKIDQYRDFWTPGLNSSHPVRNVSWRQAGAYANRAGKALPTEAQWEAAARGSDGRVYPWGNDPVSEVTRFLANTRTGVEDYDGYAYTAPVMNFGGGVSPFGAFNMVGNVWEWCDDFYDPGRYAYPSSEDPATGLQRGAKPFGDENYPNPIEKDIREARVGPLRGDERVIRGGSFADPIERCRCDTRAGARPDTHQNNIGFRCVLPLPPDCPQVAMSQ